MIYIDMDGVIADFDKSSKRILKTDNPFKWEFVWGTTALWKKLDADPLFWVQMEMMEDFPVLWNYVKDWVPAVLTATPKKDDHLVALQKKEWIQDHLGENIEVITCVTSAKPNYCKPGDILIDDRAVNRDAWVAKGGLFIVHENAYKTIYELEEIFNA